MPKTPAVDRVTPNRLILAGWCIMAAVSGMGCSHDAISEKEARAVIATWVENPQLPDNTPDRDKLRQRLQGMQKVISSGPSTRNGHLVRVGDCFIDLSNNTVEFHIQFDKKTIYVIRGHIVADGKPAVVVDGVDIEHVP